MDARDSGESVNQIIMPKISRTGEGRSRYPFWVIINRKRGSVWIGNRDTCVFETEADAVAEFNRQKAALPPGIKTSYEIERIYAPGSHAENHDRHVTETVDELEEFARQAKSASLPYPDDT